MPLVAGVESGRGRVHGDRIGSVDALQSNLEATIIHVHVDVTTRIVSCGILGKKTTTTVGVLVPDCDSTGIN